MNAERIRLFEATERKPCTAGLPHLGVSDDFGPSEKAIGYFPTEEEARAAAKGRGEWGSSGTVKVRDAVRFENGEVFILASSTPVRVYQTGREAAIERALAKLDPAERELFGYPAK